MEWTENLTGTFTDMGVNMWCFRFINKNNRRTFCFYLNNVSRKNVLEYLEGQKPLSEFAFYLDGKYEGVHKALHHRLGIRDYSDLEIIAERIRN